MSKKWGDPNYMKTRWKALVEVAQDCEDCVLHRSATQKVVGDPICWTGPKSIVFIGEAPGVEEDAEGTPFVGRAGQKLRTYIEGLHLPVDSFGIMDLVQCRAPDNRDPQPQEINACSRFFMEKLRMWNPQVIIPLGKPACSRVFGVHAFQITSSACIERKTNIKYGSQKIRVPAFPMPHPSWGIQHPDVYAGMWGKLDRWLILKGIKDRIEE